MRRNKIPIDFVPVGSKLTFIKKTQSQISDAAGKAIVYLLAIYRCECGTEKELNVGNVKSGKIVSCGCFKNAAVSKRSSTHGMSKHPLFKIWIYMKNRCENKNATAYPYYGAIGVTVCDEWRKDFMAFYNWAVLNGWEKGLQLDKDKVPTEKGLPALVYSPEMCCFLTRKENCNSRKSNHRITFNGRTQNMTEWEKELGFKKDNIFNRLKRGWSEERALTTPVIKR